MPGTDAQLGSYQAIVDALKDDPDWAAVFKPGNRITVEDDRGEFNPFNFASNDNDFPSFSLEPSGGEESPFQADETFGTYDDAGPCVWEENARFRFKLVLVSQLLNEKESANLDYLTRRALLKAGPKLGTDFVYRYTFRWETERTPDDDAGGMVRYRTEMTVEVETAVLSDDLTGA